jgi:hypothetical protein
MPKWPTRPPQVGTVGELIRRRMDVEIYCERIDCRHHAAVNLEALQSEHGDGFPVAGFVARSRCSRCGARHPEITIRVSPSANPRVIGPTLQPGEPSPEQ